MKLIRFVVNQVSRTRREHLGLAILYMMILSFGFMTKVEGHEHKKSPYEVAVYLETEFWTFVEDKDIKGFSDLLAPIFQGNSPTGIYNRTEEIQGLAAADLLSFAFENIIVTAHDEILIITYDLLTTGTGIVDGPNLSVWRKGKDGWKMISHSYMNFPAT